MSDSALLVVPGLGQCLTLSSCMKEGALPPELVLVLVDVLGFLFFLSIVLSVFLSFFFVFFFLGKFCLLLIRNHDLVVRSRVIPVLGKRTLGPLAQSIRLY